MQCVLEVIRSPLAPPPPCKVKAHLEERAKFMELMVIKLFLFFIFIFVFLGNYMGVPNSQNDPSSCIFYENDVCWPGPAWY